MPRPRISNLQVTGSNPVGRARNSNHRMVILIFSVKTIKKTHRFGANIFGGLGRT